MRNAGEEPTIVAADAARFVEACDGFVRTIELEEGIASIAKRVDCAEVFSECALKAHESLLRPAKIEKRYAAPIEQIGVARLDRKGSVIACERLPDAVERVQHEAVVREHFRRCALSLTAAARNGSARADLPCW